MRWILKVLVLLELITCRTEMVIGAYALPAITCAPSHLHSLYQQRSKAKKPGTYAIYKKNEFLFQLPESKFRSFRDSIALKTRDTLFTHSSGRVDIHPYKGNNSSLTPVKKNTPPLVYTDKKGYVNLRLPNPKFYRYVVRFFETTGKLVFEIQSPKEELLILEKSNFVHAGAFDYEVWQDGTLQEKGRLFLSR